LLDHGTVSPRIGNRLCQLLLVAAVDDSRITSRVLESDCPPAAKRGNLIRARRAHCTEVAQLGCCVTIGYCEQIRLAPEPAVFERLGAGTNAAIRKRGAAIACLAPEAFATVSVETAC
jgi:hypothetical protein